MEKNYIYIVFESYFDFMGDTVEKINKVFYTEMDAINLVESLRKEDTKNHYNYWYNKIQVF